MNTATQWEATVRLDRLDIAVLKLVLQDPPAGIDIMAVDRLHTRLQRIWERKESEAHS